MESLPLGMMAGLIGVVTGCVLGLAARFGGFGTLSALRAAVEMGDQRRVRLWGIVCGTAIIATFMLDSIGFVRIAATPWHSIAWVPVASVAGGIFFGYGMALAGSCGFEALVRAGAGDLRALVIVAIIGISASALQTGPLSDLRALLVPETPAGVPQGAAHWMATGFPMSPFFFATMIGAVLIASALAYAPLRQSPGRILWGASVGLAVAFCLAGTTWLNGRTGGVVPVDGPGFSLPLGKAMLYLMAPADYGAMLSAGLVAGVLAGAFAGAVFRGFFRAHHAEANPSLGRMASGAVMMGIGAGLALGDPIGQGISGMATLAWSAPVMILSCLAGCFLGRRWLLDYDYRDPNQSELEAA